MNDNDIKRILLIEDDIADAELFAHSIQENTSTNYEITHIDRVESLDSDSHQETEYDVAILDMGLPGLSGIDAVEYVQKFNDKLPIIILSGSNNTTIEREAAHRGVQDYLVKGNATSELIDRSIRYSIDRKQYQNSIMYLQQCDRLTGLFSREVFQTLLSSSIVKAQSNETSLALFHIDLDNFKKVNEFYGEDIGNLVINECASRLSKKLPRTHLASRLGADQFLFAYEDFGSMDAYAALAQHMSDIIKEPFTIGQVEIEITGSIGIAFSKDGEHNTPALIKRAERAVRDAKEAGRNCYRFYSEQLDAITESRLFINLALPTALKNEEFYLCYQPKIDLQSGKVTGVETLLRWVHPEKGFISPGNFIPVAEQSGLIHDITMWVLQDAAKNAAFFAEAGLSIAVNISPTELMQDDILDWLRDASKLYSSVGCQLILELTETAVMSDVNHSLSVLHEVKDMGIKLHVDDFGTGYSSLSYLHKLPVDTLKIDRSFVMDMTEDEEDQQIVKLIISLAHGLGMTVIAEGVEDQEAVEQLKNLGCDTVQGFFYAKPMVIDDLKLWLEQRSESEEVA